MWLKRVKKGVARFFNRRRKAKSKQTAVAPEQVRKPPKRRRITGREGNDIQLETPRSLKGTITVVYGTGNVVRFQEGSFFGGKLRIKGNNNFIEFGPHSRIRGRIVVGGNNQRVVFGAYSTSVDIFIVCAEGQEVTIGSSCMLSRKIEIRTTDSHSVVDPLTGKRMNAPRPVKIGDHVWIGVGVFISKGAVIPSNSIVAAGAFVNGAFEEEGVILAGEPAKVVKTGITWQRKPREQFTQEELNQWRLG